MVLGLAVAGLLNFGNRVMDNVDKTTDSVIEQHKEVNKEILKTNDEIRKGLPSTDSPRYHPQDPGVITLPDGRAITSSQTTFFTDSPQP